MMTGPNWNAPSGKAAVACPSRGFMQMMYTYAFLAQMALKEGRAKTVREREGLDKIVSICSSCGIGLNRKHFRGLTLEQEYEEWRAWLKDARVHQSAIDILDAEEKQHADGVKEFTRRRQAGEKPQEIVRKMVEVMSEGMSMPEEKPGQDWTDISDKTEQMRSFDMERRIALSDEYLATLKDPIKDHNLDDEVAYIEAGLKAKEGDHARA